jgi:HEAT repeat protein
MTSAEPETTGNGRPEPSPQLLAVLRMDLKDSEEAVVKDEAAFLSHMRMLRSEVDNREAYTSLIGEDGGEGDSIRVAFKNVRDALKCALLLRNRAQQPIAAGDGTTFTLIPRIVLHWGQFTKGWKGRIEGRGQIVVSRLDHAVTPGEIFMTDAFADTVRHLDADRGYSFDYIGEVDLAKNSGKQPCYALSISSEDNPSQHTLPTLDLLENAMQLFRTGDQASQADAVEALGAIESEAASRELTKIALDQKVPRRVRHAALVQLQGCGGDVDIGSITKGFNKERSDVETQALLLLVLGAAGREEAFETLRNVAITATNSSRLRESALLAMRSLRGSLIADAVHTGLNAHEVEVRMAACVAAAADNTSPEVQAKLCDIAKNGDTPMNLRSTACEALASQELTDTLRGMLSQFVLERHFPLTLRRYAIDGLRRFDDPVAERAMEEVARRTNDGLRADAMIARPAMKAQRRHPRRRAPTPESHVGQVIQLRTRPYPDREVDLSDSEEIGGAWGRPAGLGRASSRSVDG